MTQSIPDVWNIDVHKSLATLQEKGDWCFLHPNHTYNTNSLLQYSSFSIYRSLRSSLTLPNKECGPWWCLIYTNLLPRKKEVILKENHVVERLGGKNLSFQENPAHLINSVSYLPKRETIKIQRDPSYFQIMNCSNEGDIPLGFIVKDLWKCFTNASFHEYYTMSGKLSSCAGLHTIYHAKF